MEVAIPSGQSDRVNVLVLGSIMSVVPPTNWAYGSEVSVVVDGGAFLEINGFEVRTSACQDVRARVHRLRRHNADADTDRKGSGDAWLAKAK